MKHTLDAKDKKLGRIASEVAAILIGKNSTEFKRNEAKMVEVHVKNASKIDFNSKKLIKKSYVKYSGYPGGLKEEKVQNVLKNKGFREIFRRAVHGMLPNNKLRQKMIKNLIITE